MSIWPTNCGLIDGIANRTAVDMAIEVCGAKIGKILQSSALETEDVIGVDDQIIDLKGRALMLDLRDSHVHPTCLSIRGKILHMYRIWRSGELKRPGSS